jgi:hypothetical protein
MIPRIFGAWGFDEAQFGPLDSVPAHNSIPINQTVNPH